MRCRRLWIPLTALSVLVVAALVAWGSRGVAVRTYALDAPNQTTVAVLRPGSRICEGPVTPQGPVRGVDIWGTATGGPARLTVTVQDPATRRRLASGLLTASAVAGGYGARLERTLPGGRRLRICLTGAAGRFGLSGSASVNPSVVMTGGTPNRQFSLVLLSNANRSLWSWLPLAFSRASLWRPGWVESWTFWALAAGLLACFGLVVVAVVQAASADEEHPPPDAADDGGGASPSMLPAIKPRRGGAPSRGATSR